MKGRPALALGLLALLALLAGGRALAMAPAGTVIRNQAEALASGERYLSNVAETVVQSLCVPLLTPDGTPGSPGQEARANPGGYAYLPYLLQNGGNDRFTFTLGHLLGPRDFDPVEVALFADLNGDGLPDGGPLSSLELGMGEALRLVVRVRLPASASGSLLLSPTARCPTGEEDRENYARVLAVRGPALFVQKEMTPTALPGEEVEVLLRVRNLGEEEALGVVLEDRPLPLPFVPGSARAPKGVVEYWDGASWVPSEPARVEGVRLHLSRLLPGEEATLAFRLRVPEGTPPGFLENRARATGPGGPAEGGARVEVLPLYRHHLGPAGNPQALPGGEGSQDDRQVKAGLAGQPICFLHTLENAGTAPDRYLLRVEGVPGGASFQLLEPGQDLPLANPLPLLPGEGRDLRVCYLAPTPLAFTARVVALSQATGAENATWDEVRAAAGPSLVKEADPPGGATLAPGQKVTYTLRVQNPSLPLTEVEVVDELSPYLEFVSASHGGVYEPEGHRVVWRFPNLPAGELALTLEARVRQDAPDDARVENRFQLRAKEAPNPLLSNPVRHPVFGTKLLLKKEVSPQVARVGDRLTYRLTLQNPSALPLTVRLEDTPPPHTRYEPGTARLCQGGALEPRLEGGKLVWEGLDLPAGGSLCLEYALRLLPGAQGELLNTAQALGQSAGGAATASGIAQALVRVEPGPFALEGVLLGRVFLDWDGDGRFGPKDTPLPGARLLLPNGLQAVTDASGRYAFRGVFGPLMVMLDPHSAPFPPLPLPEDLGEGYRKRATVQGATVVDFPLRPPRGRAEVTRETSLRFGPLLVQKRLVRVGEKLLVEIRLKSSEPLPDFLLKDPLPQGGERSFAYEVFQGEETLSYEVDQEVLTDPEVRWRYP
ncbi:DUF11 domain-containing protein [Thermus filiformis]|uniref:DUF11 domain-containing protein n=1 Tax=Thermus filiformis TaxID=276 RepID=A0A0A2X7A7_THEFI|nr:DUF11 domain-containing protein [Thermus filiformis]KGQ21099.1 hypothetical protein THFILI_01770 [Thermus filiformis]